MKTKIINHIEKLKNIKNRFFQKINNWEQNRECNENYNHKLKNRR